MCEEKGQPSETTAHKDEGQVEQEVNHNNKVRVRPVDPAVEKRYKELVQYARKNGHPDL